MSEKAVGKMFAEFFKLPSHVKVMEHKMPTSKERQAEIRRKIEAGEPIGASHVAALAAPVFIAGSMTGHDEYAKFSPSSAKRWVDCPGTLNPNPGPQASVFNEEVAPLTATEARLGSRRNVKGYPTDRKHRDDRGCGGQCMLGLGGKCVACSEDDWT